jgi:hypothetical protein
VGRDLKVAESRRLLRLHGYSGGQLLLQQVLHSV